jgi:hypothetical protein
MLQTTRPVSLCQYYVMSEELMLNWSCSKVYICIYIYIYIYIYIFMLNWSCSKVLNQDFSLEGELRKQRHCMRRDCNDIDWMRVNKQETLYISSIFDLCEWWLHVVSVGRHTLVYLVLPAIIALPRSNAFLGRIFSACTWFDDPLRQRLKDDCFEKAKGKGKGNCRDNCVTV